MLDDKPGDGLDANRVSVCEMRPAVHLRFVRRGLAPSLLLCSVVLTADRPAGMRALGIIHDAFACYRIHASIIRPHWMARWTVEPRDIQLLSSRA